MNYSDSERIASFLESHKIRPTKNISQADFVIFNTCGVRQMAEDRVYGQVRNLRMPKRPNGCKIFTLELRKGVTCIQVN